MLGQWPSILTLNWIVSFVNEQFEEDVRGGLRNLSTGEGAKCFFFQGGVIPRGMIVS